MTTRPELYLPPVEPRWERTRDLVNDLGVRLIRKDATGRPHPSQQLGAAPNIAQLYEGDQVFYPSGYSLSSRAWAWIAHEAVHAHVGTWSLDDECPMLPFELELLRRIANPADRRACYRYLEGTQFDHVIDSDDSDVIDLISNYRDQWTASLTWTTIREMCRDYGLPMDGTIIEKKEKPMKVKGITITQETIESAIIRMKSGEFTLSTIESIVSQAQNILSRDTINRVADRIIQQQRKAENIIFDGKKWMWTGKP